MRTTTGISRRPLAHGRPLAAAWLTALALTWAAPVEAAGPAISHLPPASRFADEPIHLDFRIEPASALDKAWITYRTIGSKPWRTAPIRLTSTGLYRATIPGDVVHDNGVEYVVYARDSTQETRAAFASEDAPHPVLVAADPDEVLVQSGLRELEDRKSELRLSGSIVDYSTLGAGSGKPTAGPGYHDLQLAYRYYVLGGIEYIEAGVGRMRGTIPATGETTSRPQVGFDRGWGEIGFRWARYFGLGLQVMLGGDEDTFRLGGGIKLRFGRSRGNRLELLAAVAAGVGHQVGASFYLESLRHFPMRLDLLLTNWPDADQETGELVRWTFGYALASGHVLHLSASYQARSDRDHGLGVGTGVDFRF